MSKETMKLALEALENLHYDKGSQEHQRLDTVDAIKALEEALAKQEQRSDRAIADSEHMGEPVAWRTFDGEGLYFYCSYEDNETYADVWNKRNPNHKGWVEPLYTTPQQRTWVGLTDEEVAEIERNAITRRQAIRAIEAKLKEKNT
jgi:hypothetical protein